MSRRTIDIRKFAGAMRGGLGETLQLDCVVVDQVLAAFDHVLAAVLLDVVAGPAATREVGNPPRQKRTARRAPKRPVAVAVAPIAQAEAARD